MHMQCSKRSLGLLEITRALGMTAAILKRPGGYPGGVKVKTRFRLCCTNCGASSASHCEHIG